MERKSLPKSRRRSHKDVLTVEQKERGASGLLLRYYEIMGLERIEDSNFEEEATAPMLYALTYLTFTSKSKTVSPAQSSTSGLSKRSGTRRKAS